MLLVITKNKLKKRDIMKKGIVKRELCVLISVGMLTSCGKADVSTNTGITQEVATKEATTIEAKKDEATTIEAKKDETTTIEEKTDEATTIEAKTDESTPEELFKSFCEGEITAEVKTTGSEEVTMDASFFQFLGTPEEEIDPNLYVTIADPVDLDNDGEVEFILENEIYGDNCFDCKDGEVVCFAQGEGTTGYCFYTNYDGANWIVHSDSTHEGRCTYNLEKYDGNLEVVDSFTFGWEDWDDDGNKRYYKDAQDITEEEFEALKAEIVK